MRKAFSDTLVRLALADPRIVLLTGDHGYALFDDFRKACPEQYINAGIAEQNMVGMAAGLARTGFRPFVYGLAAFVPVRVVEQIKLDIAHDDLPVVLLGDGAGFVYSHLGTSHQSTEDIACMRAIPGLTIMSPADRHEMVACLEHSYALKAPTYLRMGKADLGDVHPSPLADQGATSLLRLRAGLKGRPVVLATGSMTRVGLDIALEFNLSAWSVPCIKPLYDHTVIDAMNGSDDVIVLEEHSVLGGLGSAIAEICSANRPIRVHRIGVNDRFSKHCGTYAYLLEEHGLDKESLRDRIAIICAGHAEMSAPATVNK